MTCRASFGAANFAVLVTKTCLYSRAMSETTAPEAAQRCANLRDDERR